MTTKRGISAAGQATSSTGEPSTAEQAVSRARELRSAIAALSADIDLNGCDPAKSMEMIGQSGLTALAVPTELGGLWPEDGSGLVPLVETWLEISAGDGSVGQIWSQTTTTAMLLFAEAGLPRATRSAIAGELLRDGRRLIASQADEGRTFRRRHGAP